ncbi:MAG: hypothetical protein RLZZ627_766 [Pseudomonadota bacterium]|jgi:hypothetical protein
MVNYLVRSEVLRELASELNGDLPEGVLMAVVEEFGPMTADEISVLMHRNRSAVQAMGVVALRKLAKRHPGHRDWLEPIDKSIYHTSAGWPAAEVY